MEASLCGGQLATKPSEDDAGVDRLSALPNDVLLRVLLCLGDAAAAGRTSVLSSRWRRLWALLPELRFPFSTEPRVITSALAAHEAAINCLDVATEDAAPESVSAWLPVAARRLSGRLVFKNRAAPGRSGSDGVEEEAEERGTLELTCFERATTVSLEMGFLGLAVPPAGVFGRLIELSLECVWFHGPCELGDAVSSPRCPCLQKLTGGLDNLTVKSDSLREMTLDTVIGLRQITVVSPALEHFTIFCCFILNLNRPVADISAPQLKVLKWGDLFDPDSVQLGTMEHLQSLCPFPLHVYGFLPNHPCVGLLRCFHFKVIQYLHLSLAYLPDINNKPYLLEDITMLPDITLLDLRVIANGHAFGASLFHVLRMCPGIRKLGLELSHNNLEDQPACPPGCICDQQQNWKTKELLLNRLLEVEITELRGSENELTFVKQLFNWAAVLRKMTVTFNSSMTESLAEVSCQILRSFSRSEICLEFYLYKDMIKVLYAPEN